MNRSRLAFAVTIPSLLGLLGCSGSSKGKTAIMPQADGAMDSQSTVAIMDTGSDVSSENDAPIQVTRPVDGAMDSQSDIPEIDAGPDARFENDIPIPVAQQVDAAVDSQSGMAAMDTGSSGAMDGAAMDSSVSLCPSPEGIGEPGVAQLDGGAPVAQLMHVPSTNQGGYAYDIYCDSSAVYRTIPCNAVKYGGSCMTGGTLVSNYIPPGTPWILQCLADLQAVGDVSTIKTASTNCEGASFGVAVVIIFNGNSTNDLNCFPQPTTPAQAQVLSDCLGH